MSGCLPWIRLVRFPNLVIVALTQSLLYGAVFLPSFEQADIEPEMSPAIFSLFVLVTIAITGAGYIINDIHDQVGDAVNKPARRIIGRLISEPLAYRVYYAMGIFGFIVSAALAFKLDKLPYLVLFPLAFGLLYYYTVSAKRKVLWGNILIAFFCAGVAGILWLAELRALFALSQASPPAFSKVRDTFVWYGIFAFLINAYREIVKDLEDLPGDRIAGVRSLPVVHGAHTAVKVAQGVAVGLLLFLAAQARTLFFSFGLALPVCLGLGVGFPLFLSILLLGRARQPSDFRRVSHLIKMIIFSGVVSLFFARPV
ncbi:MAG: geranylgeranylglycerol-phosphate geranylgeranyltransferase [Saprospiraceae bacterium]